MSLFEVRDAFGIHNPFENPSIPLSSIGLDQVFGNPADADTGESITPANSLAIPTFFRCVGLLSTVIAGCPVRVYKNPGKVEQFPRLMDSSNLMMTYTQYELWELVVVHLCLYGNAYILKVKDGMGRVIDLKPINPSLVQPKLRNGTKIFLITRVKSDGTVDTASPPIEKTEDDIMHVPGLSYDGIQGLSPVDQAARTLGTAKAADKLAARFYTRGTTLTGVLNVRAPLANQEQADDIRRKWQSKNGGIGNAAEVAILDAETSFQQLTIPPDQLQFLESRRWQTTEIARMFGIPPHLVGDVEKSTSWGTGIEQQNIGFISYTIAGWTNRIEQRISRELIPRSQIAEFDLDHLMRGSTIERFQAYGNAIQWGWLTRNEAREKENMVPLPGLSKPLTPTNMVAGNPPTAAQNAGAAQSAQAQTDQGGESDDEDS